MYPLCHNFLTDHFLRFWRCHDYGSEICQVIALSVPRLSFSTTVCCVIIVECIHKHESSMAETYTQARHTMIRHVVSNRVQIGLFNHWLGASGDLRGQSACLYLLEALRRLGCKLAPGWRRI